MKVLKILVGVIVAAIALVVVAAAMQPSHLHVERSRVIAAAPADLFPYANDFRLWVKWNPWQDLDPNQKVTMSENPAGVGSWYTWEGNSDVGKGKMTVSAAEEPTKVEHDLEFIEPMQSMADITMTFTPEGEGTKVTWAFDEELGFGSKVFGLFMDMDAMLGADFEKGLNKLAPLAEADKTARLEREAAEAAAAEAAAAAATVDTTQAAPAE